MKALKFKEQQKRKTSLVKLRTKDVIKKRKEKKNLFPRNQLYTYIRLSYHGNFFSNKTSLCK